MSEKHESATVKQQVRKLLKKNPLLTSKTICKLLGLNYRKHQSYISNIKSEWKFSLRFGLGSKPHLLPSFHNARGWVYVRGLGLDRDLAVERGWVKSKAKNRALIWKDPLGRMEWFETDRVNIYVKAPALKGRVFQLFCNGFSMTELITSITILSKILESIRLKSAHAVFETTKKLPYMVIDLFKLSNGIIIKSGDATHPNAIEVHFCYPDWAEKNERLLGEIYKMIHPSKPETPERKREPFYVS